MKKESEHKLLLKIPVFISVVDDYNNGMSFWTFTPNDIIAYLKDKIRLYGLQEPYSYQKKDKSEEVTIESIKPEDVLFDEDPALLLRISTGRTNLCGGYIKHENESSSITPIKYSDTLSVDTNIIVLYPRIVPNKDEKVQWFIYIFVYEDPSKPNFDLCSLARKLMLHVFEKPIRNIKEDKFKKEIEQAVSILKTEIILSTFDDGDGIDIPQSLQAFQYELKQRHTATITIDNLTSDEASQMLGDNYFKGFGYKCLKFVTRDNRKLQATITEKVKGAQVNIKKAFEDSFNFSIEVSDEDLSSNKLFETEEVKKNIKSLLNELLDK